MIGHNNINTFQRGKIRWPDLVKLAGIGQQDLGDRRFYNCLHRRYLVVMHTCNPKLPVNTRGGQKKPCWHESD